MLVVRRTFSHQSIKTSSLGNGTVQLYSSSWVNLIKLVCFPYEDSIASPRFAILIHLLRWSRRITNRRVSESTDITGHTSTAMIIPGNDANLVYQVRVPGASGKPYVDRQK